MQFRTSKSGTKAMDERTLAFFVLMAVSVAPFSRFHRSHLQPLWVQLFFATCSSESLRVFAQLLFLGQYCREKAIARMYARNRAHEQTIKQRIDLRPR